MPTAVTRLPSAFTGSCGRRAPALCRRLAVGEVLVEATTYRLMSGFATGAVPAVRDMKEDGPGLLGTIGSVSRCRSLLRAGLVDRFRVVMFPVITAATGWSASTTATRTPLEMIDGRTFDGSIQRVEYRPACSTTRRSRPPRDLARRRDGGRSGQGEPHEHPREAVQGRRWFRPPS